MAKHVRRKPFIEIDVININQNETKASRKHIKAEGFFPSLIVSLFSVFVLVAFEEINDLFCLIKLIIGKLHKHNYYLLWI